MGGAHLDSLGIKSIFELKEITYIGFTSVLLNIFSINKNKFQTKFVLRISGLPRLNIIRKFLWKIALKKIHLKAKSLHER